MANKSENPDMDGQEASGTPPTSRLAEVASRGIRTARDMVNLGVALLSDIITGAVGNRDAKNTIAGMSVTLRAADFQQKHGAETEIASLPGTSDPDTATEIALATLRKKIVYYLGSDGPKKADAIRAQFQLGYAITVEALNHPYFEQNHQQWHLTQEAYAKVLKADKPEKN